MNAISRGAPLLVIPVLALCVGALGACGGSSSPVVRGGSSAPVSTPTSTESTPTTPTTPSTHSSSSAAHPTVRVVPSTGLHNGQQVQVIASGFTPGEALQVIQCADRGSATGPGDCNLDAMLAATSDSTGRVIVRLRVVKGPFGGSNRVCNAHQRCLVSVTQASLSPTEEADTPISFGAQQ